MRTETFYVANVPVDLIIDEESNIIDLNVHGLFIGKTSDSEKTIKHKLEVMINRIDKNAKNSLRREINSVLQQEMIV